MRIRLAEEVDLPAIGEIANHYIRTSCAHFSTEPQSEEEVLGEFRATRGRFPWLVAVDDSGAVAGFARAAAWKGRCAYEWSVEATVYLRPENRGHGLGRALCDRLFDLLRRQGYRSVISAIVLPNHASIRLVEALGMRHAGTFDRVGFKHGRWHSVGYWLARLVESDSEPTAVRSVEVVAAKPGAI